MNLLYARILVPRLHTLICITNSALYVHHITTMYFPSKPNRSHQVLIMSTTGNGIYFIIIIIIIAFTSFLLYPIFGIEMTIRPTVILCCIAVAILVNKLVKEHSIQAMCMVIYSLMTILCDSSVEFCEFL